MGSSSKLSREASFTIKDYLQQEKETWRFRQLLNKMYVVKSNAKTKTRKIVFIHIEHHTQSTSNKTQRQRKIKNPNMTSRLSFVYASEIKKEYRACKIKTYDHSNRKRIGTGGGITCDAVLRMRGRCQSPKSSECVVKKWKIEKSFHQIYGKPVP
jgi:hypothetical protein